MLLIHDVGTLEPLRDTWVALTIAVLRSALIYPMTFECIFPAFVAVIAARTFEIVFASLPITPSTDTINGVK
jgi:hypothetical protein